MHVADAVIVGAGFAGAATAHHLRRRGLTNILLLEQESVPGTHASGKNAAMALQVTGSLEETRLAVEGRNFIAATPNEFFSRSLFRQTGSLVVARHSDALNGMHEVARRLDLDVRSLAAEALARHVPPLQGCRLARGLHNPSDGVVDVHGLLQGYLAGQRVWTNTTATGIGVEKGAVRWIDTTQGRVHTPWIVNAAGPWASNVASLAGALPLDLVPRRRHLYVGVTKIAVNSDWPFVWQIGEDESYFRPEAGGILMSPCDEDAWPAATPPVAEDAAQRLAERFIDAFPTLAESGIRSTWACLRTFAHDRQFVIGEDPVVSGFCWAAGLGGHGMTTSAAVGRLAADTVVGSQSDAHDFFAPDRFVRDAAALRSVG